MAILATGAAVAFQSHQQAQARPHITRGVEWAATGIWLKADTHVHSKFSDGNSTIDELAERAARNGCDVLAVTDHTDGNLKAATPEYHSALAAVRARDPHLVLLTGIEWNVPPGKGQDHAVLLFPPEMDDAVTTAEFKQRFDDENKEGENPELALTAFRWLQEKAKTAAVPPVMFLDHPSRKAKSVAAVQDELQWLSKSGGQIFAGVEGAPGHQHANPLGAYDGPLHPEDRWDPAIAPPGAVWDRLLASGSSISGALATSDFHSEENGDYWPCEFSATWVYAPDRTPAGVLRALRAGTFFGVHGDIARHVQLSVSTDGLPRPAIAGERVHVAAGRTVRVALRAEVPDTDWRGASNHLDVVEIFGVTAGGTSVLASGKLESGALEHDVEVPPGGMAIRARGRRKVDGGPDLLFYTNAVQIR